MMSPLPEGKHRSTDDEEAQGGEGRHPVERREPFSKKGRAGRKDKHEEQCQEQHAERMSADGVPKSLPGHPANLPLIGG
jgi:hypothetical protein